MDVIMVYKRYYSPFEESKPPAHPPPRPVQEHKPIEVKQEIIHHQKEKSPFSFFNKVGIDDLIIIGVLLILLMEDKENRDIPLILSLGFLFLIQYIEAD